MKLLVTGGRDYDDRKRLFQLLDQMAPTCVITGGYRGADQIAQDWALQRGLHTEMELRIFPAIWKRDGGSAGPKRNSRMIAEAVPDMALALPGGQGTADCVAKLRAAGIPVVVAK